jgi:diguanylate cyclase (GGDEF)-like protein
MRWFPSRFRLPNSLAVRFVVMTGLAIATIVPLRLMEVHSLRSESIALGYANVARTATVGIDRLNEILEQSHAILSVTALLPIFAGPSPPSCHTIFTPIVAHTPWMSTLSAVSAEGRITCSSNTNAEGLDISDRPYFRTAIAQKRFQLSAILQSRLSNAPMLVAAMPVELPGSNTAALVMSIDSSWFNTTVSNIADRSHDGLALIIEKGAIVYRSSSDDGFESQLPADFMQTVGRMDRESALAIRLQDGRNYVVAARDIPNSDSMLVIGIPQSALQAHALAVERNLLEDLMMAVAIVVLVFWLGHENFVRPVQALAAAARDLGRGRFHIDLDTSGWAGEFLTVANAIKTAAVDLASRDNIEKETRARLLAQCLEDPLTGLKNRRGLDLFTETEWRACTQEQQPFSVIAFDIDWFKQYNDHFGHSAGDEVLRGMARILQDQATLAGGLAARTGGEEFTLVLPNKTSLETIAVAEAIVFRVLRQQMPHPRSQIGIVTLSAGVACAMPQESMASSDVFHVADRALYDAKNGGRNRIIIGDAADQQRAA